MTATRNAQIVALHHAGRSLRAIGQEVKLSHEAVRLVLIAAGLTAHASRDRFDVLEAWRLYEQGWSMAATAEAIGVTPAAVVRAFQRHGLPARRPGRPTKASVQGA